MIASSSRRRGGSTSTASPTAPRLSELSGSGADSIQVTPKHVTRLLVESLTTTQLSALRFPLPVARSPLSVKDPTPLRKQAVVREAGSGQRATGLLKSV